MAPNPTTSYTPPYPILQRGNSSFPGGAYEQDYRTSSGLVTVTHKVREAKLLSYMLEKDYARFACRVNIYSAGYHRFFWAGDEAQQVELNEGFKHDTKEFHPLIVATRDMVRTLGEADGVSPNWFGKIVQINKGAKIGLGEPYILAPYKHLDEVEFANLHKNLLHKKGSDLQREFLHVAKDSKAFTRWIRSKIAAADGNPVPITSFKIAEREFVDPSPEIEQKLFETWSDVSPALARKQSFWGEVSLRHIEKGKLESSYLASFRYKKGATPVSGIDRIEKALASGKAKEIDFCVRTVLRRLSGMYKGVRGRISVYSNCHFARAWWRSYLIQEICTKTTMDRSTIQDIFHISLDYWEEIVSWMLNNNAVLSDTALLGGPAVLRTQRDGNTAVVGDTTTELGDMVSGYTNVRDIFVKLLAVKYQENPKCDLFKKGSLNKLSKELDLHVGMYEFGLLKATDLEEILDPAMDELSA